MRSRIPTRDAERIYAESYLDYKNDIFIFIEDKKESTRKIMLELIQRSISPTIKIDRLHSLGGRKKVIEAFENRNAERNEIYIIDGDLYLLFEARSLRKGLVVLDRYCVENYLLDKNTIENLLYEEAFNEDDKEELLNNFDFINWFSSQNLLLIKLFKIYAIEKMNNLNIETVGYSINSLRQRTRSNQLLCKCDEELINKRIEELKKSIINSIGNIVYINNEDYIEKQTSGKSSEIIVSAKDYILPLVFDRFKKYAGNTSAKRETLEFRMAKICNIQPFKENLYPHIRANI